MSDSKLKAALRGIGFGTWLFAPVLGLMAAGCATTPKDSMAGAIEGGATVNTTAPEADPDDGPTETVEQRTEEGILQSTAEGWRDVDGNFVHHGAYTVYWEGGQKKTVVYYKNGVRHGARTSWHADGKIWKTGQHDDGRAVGQWVEWHSTGEKAREMIFIRGGLNGWMTEWYPDGTLRHKVMYKKGLRQGRESRWDKDGTLLYEADFLDDVVQP